MGYRVHIIMHKKHNRSILYASLKSNKVKDYQKKLTKKAFNMAHFSMFITLSSLFGIIGTLGYFIAYQTETVLIMLTVLCITCITGALLWHNIDRIANELYEVCSDNKMNQERYLRKTQELDHIAKCAREYQQEMHEYKSELDRIKQNA